MSGSKGADVDDQDAADAANQEVLVLDRLLYRNRSQHRSAKYFTLSVKVRRACRTFAAPDVPDLMATGLAILARVPDSRNGRAREAWVRSAAAALQRMSIAAVACADVLEAAVQASKHLAHQVSQTYFMALSVVFLACLARLFVCCLHLGGRLVEVHGALLRTLLAQPSTSECLSTAALAACRIPEETATFLSRLRGAGGANKLRRVKAPDRATAASAAAAAAAAAAVAASAGGSLGAIPVKSSMSAPFPTTDRTGGKDGAEVGGHGEVGGASGGLVFGGDDDGGDSDDTGVRIGRAVAVEQAENNLTAGSVFRGQGAAAKMTERQGGRRGKAASDVGRTGGEAEGGGRSGGDRGGRDRDRRLELPRKKVILASEFSDSSDDENDSSVTKPEQQQQQSLSAAAASPIGATASRSGSGPPPPISSPAKKPPRPQPSTPSACIAIASVSPAGGSDGSGVVVVDRASAPPEEVPPGGHVGWMIDRGPVFTATPPQCASKRKNDVVPPSSSPSSSSSAAAAAAAVPPHGEEASLGIPGTPSDMADGVAEGIRGRIEEITAGAEMSSDEKSVDNGTRATTGEEAIVGEGPAFFCVTGVEANTTAPGAGGVVGNPPTPPVGFPGSSSSAVEVAGSCSATGETRRRKRGGRGKKQATPKRKGPPSSLPTPSIPTPSAVDGVGGYGQKAEASSPTDHAVEETVSDCKRSGVGGNRGEGADGERMFVALGDVEKELGVIDRPMVVSLPPEPAPRPGAVAVHAAVDAAVAAALPPVAPPHRKVDEKSSEDGGCSSSPPPKFLKQRGPPLKKEGSEPINSGAGDSHTGGCSGAKRSPAGEARGEMVKRKKKSKKASKRATKRSVGGQGGGRNAIDDIFGSFS